MLKEKIKEATTKYNDLVQKRSALLKDADTASEVKDIKEIRSKITGLNTELDQAKADLDDLKKLEKEEQRSIAPEVNEGPQHRGSGSSKDKLEIQKRAINAYIHTRDASNAAEVGLKSQDATVTIPKDIKYVPTEEVKTVADLSKYVTKFSVTTASGTYPIVKRATGKLHTVEELAKNPELAKPEFENIDWKVATYRGAIPLSKEAIDDSAADLISIVQNNANEQKINTTNDAISTVLKTFTAKSVSGTDVDAIKHILNIDLDPAYQRTIVASQSFYQYLDTLKDKNGRYMLNDPITTTSPAMLLGVPVIVVNDELLGKSGEAHAFIGDLRRAVLYPDRADLSIRWVDNDVYGTYLSAFFRFGVFQADKNAGYFVTAGTAGN